MVRRTPLLLALLVMCSCKHTTTQFTEPPTEDPAEVAASPITSPRTTVDALIFEESIYPVSRFRSATGPECKGAPHWHSNEQVPRIGRLRLQGTAMVFTCDAEVQLQGLPAEGCKKDPNQNGCGHGEVSEVRREQVQIFQICLDVYANLTCGG